MMKANLRTSQLERPTKYTTDSIENIWSIKKTWKTGWEDFASMTLLFSPLKDLRKATSLVYVIFQTGLQVKGRSTHPKRLRGY